MEVFRDFDWWDFPLNIYRLISGSVTGCSAFAGAFVGILGGSLIGQAYDIDTDIILDAVLGAIFGVVLSTEVLGAYHDYPRLNQSNSRYTYDSRRLGTDFVEEPFYDRFVPHQSSSARLMASHRQSDFSSKGLSRDLLRKLPFYVMPHNKKDGHEESFYCTICLQDIVGGETARKLPLCFHTFHLSCVDKWLAAHNSCPVCRQCLHLITTDY